MGGSFEPSKPLSRPTTSEGGGRGPVVLKQGAGGAGGGFSSGGAGGFDESDPFSSKAQAAVAAAVMAGDEAAQSQMMMEGSALAGPAGAALAGAVPMTGVMGKSALERLTAESQDGMEAPGDAHPPFKSEADRRKHALDAKRRDLVETRMRPQQPGLPDVTEPRPPSQPRVDPRLGMVKPMSPRQLQSLEVEGQPPP